MLLIIRHLGTQLLPHTVEQKWRHTADCFLAKGSMESLWMQCCTIKLQWNGIPWYELPLKSVRLKLAYLRIWRIWKPIFIGNKHSPKKNSSVFNLSFTCKSAVVLNFETKKKCFSYRFYLNTPFVHNSDIDILVLMFSLEKKITEHYSVEIYSLSLNIKLHCVLSQFSQQMWSCYSLN